MTLLCKEDLQGLHLKPRKPCLTSFPITCLFALFTPAKLRIPQGLFMCCSLCLTSLSNSHSISSLPLLFFSTALFSTWKSYILLFICLPEQNVSFPRREVVFCSLLYPQGLELYLAYNRYSK